MSPSLHSNQFVIVSNNLNKNLLGRVVFFNHNGLVKVKRVARVENNSVYLLGDNLIASQDSRQFGYIAIDQVIGRLIWPRI